RRPRPDGVAVRDGGPWSRSRLVADVPRRARPYRLRRPGLDRVRGPAGGRAAEHRRGGPPARRGGRTRRGAALSRVEYREVRKSFGDVVALEALDLLVPDGAFLVMLGPSGCGKTTALRILAGLELPDSGSVLLGERNVTRLQPRDRDIAMVFQSYALYPHYTVRQNIEYPLTLRSVPKQQRRQSAEEVAELLEIGH